MTSTFPPVWDSSYLDPSQLRAEVDAATDSFLLAITEVIPSNEIKGLYLKGSALKEWDSPIDYVPELSDIDVHVLFSDNSAAERHDSDLERALRIGQRAEELYGRAVPNPVHVPRIQLVVANMLYALPDFIPSPASTIRVCVGPSYPASEPTLEARQSAARLRTEEQRAYLAKLGEETADKIGKHLRVVLRGLSWRVAPTVPRTLDLLGLPFEEVWSANRTRLVLMLRMNDLTAIADAYVDFYVHSWRYFLSEDRDSEEARSALQAGASVLRGAIERLG